LSFICQRLSHMNTFFAATALHLKESIPPGRP
jgi:hypothetical protein